MANGTRTYWTPETEARLLDKVAETGNIILACKLTNISHAQVYRAKLADPEFATRLAEARQIGCHLIEDTCIAQALEGIDEPVFYEGKRIVDDEGNPIFVKQYAWTFRIFMLKAMFPEKYRERYGLEHSGPDGGPIALRGTVQIYIPDNGRTGQADTPAETAPGAVAVEIKPVT